MVSVVADLLPLTAGAALGVTHRVERIHTVLVRYSDARVDTHKGLLHDEHAGPVAVLAAAVTAAVVAASRWPRS